MKESKRRQSLSGAVLIMILTVMFVLIILLTATLTTVTTANQRIYTKFEENQAYYTARSALDVFTQNMLSDANYVSGIDYTYTKAGSSDTVQMKQGLGLQMDLYMLKSQNGFCNVPQDKLKNFVTSTSDTNLQKVEYKDWFGTDSSKVKNNGKPTTDPDYKEYVEYEVELPQLANGGSQYGKLSDLEGSGSNKVPKAKIKVEVLSRDYHIGEYDISAYSSKDDFFENASDDAKAEAVVSGVRKKDKIRVKITATTTFDGVEGIAVLILDSNEPPVNNSSRAITAFGGTGSDNMSILGGMAAENTINWGSNDGYIYGPVYVEDDFLMTSNGPKLYLNSGETLVVGGDVQIENNHFQVINTTTPVIVDDKNAPFVYIGGELRTGGGLGDSPFMNMDVIAEEVNIGGKIVFDSSCTVYCKKLTCKSGSNSTYDGDIYVDGDVYIYNDNDTKITYDNGNPTVVHGGTGIIHFTGDVIDGTTNNAVTDGATTGFMKETTGFWSNIPMPSIIAEKNPTASGDSDGTKIEFQIPGRTNKKEIETHVQNFDTYYVKDEDGNRVMITVTDPDSGASVQRPEVKSAQFMADIDTMGDKTKPFTSANTGITTNLSSLTTSGGNIGGVNFNHVLDTGGGDVKAIWNFDNQNIYIKGGGTVVLQLDESKSWGYNNDNIILVDDDTTLKIIGDTDSIATGAWSNTFAKLEVYNQTTWGAYKNFDVGAGTDSLKVGNKAGVGIKVPKIFYYFTGSGNFSVQNNCLLTGYVYAPDVKINMPAASTPTPTNGMEYNGSTVSGTPVCIIGSALVKGANLPNNTGVAYINPNLDDDTPGEPIHQWQSSMYVRS